MTSPVLIAGVVLLMALISYKLFYTPKILRNRTPLPRPPDTLPLIGNGLRFVQDRQILFDWFCREEERFKGETYQISVPSLPPGVVINNPKCMDYVFKNHTTFIKGDFLVNRTVDLFGHGIINVDGDLWKRQRKAGLQFLNTNNLSALANVALPRTLDGQLKKMKELTEDDIVDLEGILLGVTTTVMGRMAYNMEMYNTDPFSQAFEYASDKTGLRFQNPLWRLTELFTGSELRKNLKTVQKLGLQIVQTAVDRRENKNQADADEKLTGISGSLINALLDQLPSHQLVADSALNYLTGGRDTTAQGLTWCFYTLMHRPDIVSKIRDEIRNSPVALKKLSADPFAEDYESVQPTELPYTLATFYEAIRLFPPVPYEIKQTSKETTLPDGTHLPKGSIVVWCIWAMNHSKNIWGPDAHEFKPERWIDENGHVIPKTAAEFPVFNGGARLCLGKKMAEQVATVILSQMVWNFEFEDVEKKERISRNSLTLPMDGGLPIKVRRRAEKI